MITPAHKKTLPLGHGDSVLVVEDNAGLRRSVVLLLRALNYDPIEAANPPDALALLDTSEADVLFTDLIMPGGMDGLELARQACAKRSALKVLLTSGYAGDTLRQRFGLAAVPFPLLLKPYRMDELAHAMHATIRARQPRRADGRDG